MSELKYKNNTMYLGDKMDIDGNTIETVDNPEFIEVTTDSEGKVLNGTTVNGEGIVGGVNVNQLKEKVDKINTEEIDALLECYNVVNDPENRVEMTTDNEEKVVSFRDKEGVLNEPSGIKTKSVETNSIKLSEEGLSDFADALKKSGFVVSGLGDFSDAKIVELPEPAHYGFMNLIIPQLPVSTVVEGYVQYFDYYGNSFKKSCEVEIQGQTSRIFALSGGKGNYTLDITDGSEIKFGSWAPQDSFHLKGCAKDVTRGYLATSYKYAYLFMEYLDAKPNKALSKENKITYMKATGDRFSDWPDDARCLPDGFPIELYINGEYHGLYALQLKKHRKNYSMKKSDYTSFFLDGGFMPNGYNSGFWLGDIHWEDFEIKNPKDLVCMDGTKYDGDNPKELIDDTSEYYDATNKAHKGSAQTKEIIKSWSTKYLEVKTLIENQEIEQAKTKFNEYFDYKSCMLVYLFNCTMKNEDSINKNTLWGTWKNGKVVPLLWDLDGMYGEGWIGNAVGDPSARLWYGGYATSDWPLALFWSLYETEIKETYAELRRNGIISLSAWHSVIYDKWIDRIGTEAYNRDIEKWPETPSYRKNYTNTEYWEEAGLTNLSDEVQTYNEGRQYEVGDVCALSMGSNYYLKYRAVQQCTGICPVTEFYTMFPLVGGFYDSPKRMEKWMKRQIELCDQTLGYTPED